MYLGFSVSDSIVFSFCPFNSLVSSLYVKAAKEITEGRKNRKIGDTF